MTKVVLTLPMPPSVNGLWINVPGRRRVKSKIYKAWATAAGWELAIQRPSKIKGRYNIRIEAARLRKGSDIGNREKSLSDLLVKHQVVEDDSLAEQISMAWSDMIEKGKVRVTVESV